MASERMESKVEQRKKFYLNNDRVLQLIELIKNREYLWKLHHPTSIKESQVAEAWKEVSIEMGLPVEFLQQKWKSLQDTFRHVKAIHEKIITIAIDPGRVRPPSWFAYEPMLFLNQVSNLPVKRQLTIPQSICKVTVAANSTDEEDDEINEEMPDVFDDESNPGKRMALVMSRDKVLKLIELIKNREFLWNKYLPTSIDVQSQVANGWKEVSIEMGLPVDLVQRKWKSLQGSFRSIRALRSKGVDTASDTNRVRQKNWFAYEEMLFLNQVCTSRAYRIGQSTNQQSICKVTVDANSTREEDDEINEEVTDIFSNEIKHADNLPISTSIAASEEDTAHDKRPEIKEEVSDIFFNETNYWDNIAMDTSITETKGASTDKEHDEISEEVSDIFANKTEIYKRSLELTPHRTLQFIQLVKNRECLWHKLPATANNRFRIANAWKEVSTKMRLPVDLLQRKWKSLQGSFRSIRSIRSKGIATASDTKRVRTSNWFAYEPLQFLNQVSNLPVKRKFTNPQSICKVTVEANSTYEEQDEIKEEEYDPFANEITPGDNTATDTSKTESEGVRFALMAARKLDNMSPVRRKRMILKMEKQLLEEEEAQFIEKYGQL